MPESSKPSRFVTLRQLPAEDAPNNANRNSITPFATHGKPPAIILLHVQLPFSAAHIRVHAGALL